MHYIIYIDKVWLMDFVIGTYLLFLVRQTYGLQGSPLRLLISSAAGASIFVMLLLFPGMGILLKVLLQSVCVNLFLLKAAFSFRTKEMVVKSYICMSGYTLFLGGFICALTGLRPGGEKNLTCIGVLALSTAAAASAGAYLHFRRREKTEGRLYTVRLDFYGEILTCRGLADTGNSLYEPYGGRPVSILERQAVEKLLERVPEEKHYLVPFHSIGKEHGLLTAVELPKMEVEERGQRKVFLKAVAAISEEKLTEKGNYQVILHPDMVRLEE